MPLLCSQVRVWMACDGGVSAGLPAGWFNVSLDNESVFVQCLCVDLKGLMTFIHLENEP